MAHATEIAITQLRRTANSQTVLGYIAAAFLVMFGYFWYQVWALFLRPPSLFSPQAIITLVLTLCYTVVWPLFGSMMIPNSPARHFLQKQTWAEPGQIAVVVITLLLGRFAFSVFMQWIAAQPGIIDNPDLYWPAVIGVFVGAFFVPVLCWAAATPEQIIAQIQQALWIKDMERAARLRERAWAAADVRARAIIHAGQVQGALTLAQDRELAGLMLASHRTLQHGLRMVAMTMAESAQIEDLLPSTPDPELVRLYQQVPVYLAAADEQIGATVEIMEAQSPAASPPLPRRFPAASPSVSPSAPAASRGGAPRYAAEYESARGKLRGTWSAAQLAEILDKSERTARDRLAAWEAAGLVARETDGKGSFYFTESEA